MSDLDSAKNLLLTLESINELYTRLGLHKWWQDPLPECSWVNDVDVNFLNTHCLECECPVTIPGFCSDECYHKFLRSKNG